MFSRVVFEERIDRWWLVLVCALYSHGTRVFVRSSVDSMDFVVGGHIKRH